MYACICHAVTTAEVDAAVALGATSVKQVRNATGAGSGCGTCVKRLSCLVAAARITDAAPVDTMPEAERLPVPSHEPVPELVPSRELAASPEPAASREPVPGPEFQHAPHCPAAVPALG